MNNDGFRWLLTHHPPIPDQTCRVLWRSRDFDLDTDQYIFTFLSNRQLSLLKRLIYLFYIPTDISSLQFIQRITYFAYILSF